MLLLPVLAALTCPDPVPIFHDGAREGQICTDIAAQTGYTVLDLGPDWTPAALAPGPDGVAPAYRATYLAIAQGRLDDAGDEGVRAKADGGLEVFGFVPTFERVAARLADDGRHRCHDAIDDAALTGLATDIREQPKAVAAARVTFARNLRAGLERERVRKHLPDVDALAALDRGHARRVARLHAAEQYVGAIRAAQAHLVCEGLLAPRQVDGRYTWQTALAVLAFQRSNELVPRGHLDADTRALLADDSRMVDYRTALRALRERVVSATGLIEDGSAGAGNTPVMGQRLAAAAWSQVLGHAPLPDAAPDLVDAATDAAARALGWTDPATTLAALRVAPPRAAVVLPPPPPYHASHMDLAVEIDRGDVWYDLHPRAHHASYRPSLTLYAFDHMRRIPLVRWPTTIGGWKKELHGRWHEVDRWMESPVGPRVWRELYVAPAWLAPDTTPDRDLVHSIGHSNTLATDLLGPSYRSAYGLLMLVHEKEVFTRRGTRFLDERVRTHGSGSITSIFDGHSHGCHRLAPLYALRLGGFLLAHRDHVRRGEQRTWFTRRVHYHGDFTAHVTSRGYLVELTPPVPVNVLPGRIRSARKTPPQYHDALP
ncbi:MAG TPA: peptidoglycan-binding domain-containing protein [Kofleriaceae bacterium]|nr:peptidoglycan-binding domain-containing protein [Kofleriaceae bacterium]